MYIFFNIICYIFLLKYTSSYKLKSNDLLSSSLSKNFKNVVYLNSKDNDDVRNQLKELEENEFITEGWLMELNDKNVEGVFSLIREKFASDGGGIELVKIVDHVVYAKLTGSCVGCPYRSITMKDLVLNNLRKFLKSPNDSPIRVEVVNDPGT